MDILFIAEESLALAHYVTGYISKAERSNMQAIWNEVASEKSIYSRLFSFGIQSMHSRECGLYEASDLLLGEQLCGKSDSIMWIDAVFLHKRKRRIKDHKKLEELHSKEPESSDIFEHSLRDTHYPMRPNELKKCASMTLWRNSTDVDLMTLAFLLQEVLKTLPPKPQDVWS